jgi:hypothetical protein
MTATTSYTAEAKELLGGFVQRAGKSFLVIRASNVFGETETVKITPDNLAVFYATEARNLTSGMRTLAGLSGDCGPISELADLGLGWFKRVNIEGANRQRIVRSGGCFFRHRITALNVCEHRQRPRG